MSVRALCHPVVDTQPFEDFTRKKTTTVVCPSPLSLQQPPAPSAVKRSQKRMYFDFRAVFYPLRGSAPGSGVIDWCDWLNDTYTVFSDWPTGHEVGSPQGTRKNAKKTRDTNINTT